MNDERIERFRKISLYTAYVLLVLVVGWLSWFIDNEFDQAQEDRCAVAYTTASISAINVVAIEALLAQTDNSAQVPDLTEKLIQAADQLDQSCGPDPFATEP